MSWPWRSPQATRQALTAKTQARHPPELRAQRLREIAYRRLLARLFTAQPERWVVKGGAALLLRLDPNRTSNDIDLAYVADAGEHAVALEALIAAADHDLGDFFTFEIARGRALTVDPEHPLERALSVPVIARVGRTTFAEFSIDLGLPRVGLDIEWIEPVPTLTADASVDVTPPVALLALPAQIADKVCAIFERHGDDKTPSSRARDLADIAMIATQKPIDGTSLVDHLRREEGRRVDAGMLLGPLPDSFSLDPEQRTEWSTRWAKATRNAPITFEDAERLSRVFLDPVLNGSASGKHWSAERLAWRSAGNDAP